MARRYALVLLAGGFFFLRPCFSQDKPASLYSACLKGFMADFYGDTRRALREYLKLYSQDEKAAVGLRLAVDYLKVKKFAPAIKILEKMSRGKTLNRQAYILLALAYEACGKREKSRQTYRRFLQRLYGLYPQNLEIVRSLAELYVKEGNWAEAEKLYSFVMQKKKDSPDIYVDLAYVYEEEKKLAEAVQLLKEALRRFPDNSDLLNSLAYIYAEAGRELERAEAMAKKALEIDPNSPAYLDSLGWVYYQQRKYNLALKYIKMAAQSSQDPVIREHLGDVWLAVGKPKQAEKCWRSIIKDFPQRRKYLEEKIRQARSGKRR